MDSPFNVFGMCAIVTFEVIENNEIYCAMETTTARFYCTIMKIEISILYHVIVNSQLSRDNLTRRYILYDMIVCVPSSPMAIRIL